MKGRRQYLDHLLRRLRLRLTVLFAIIATAGLSSLILALVLVQEGVDADRLDSALRDQATSAVNLVYVTADNMARVDPQLEDLALGGPGGLAVYALDAEGNLRSLWASAGADIVALRDLARTAQRNYAQSATFDTVRMHGVAQRTAAVTWPRGGRPGGVVVAFATPMSATSGKILVPALLGGAALLLLLTLTAWEVAGRSLRPAAEAIGDRERFLSSAAHELRSPLARLRAGAEAVRRTVPLSHEAGAALHRLVAVADSAAQVVANLLLATRIEHSEVPVRREVVRLDSLIMDLEHVYPNVVIDVGPEVTVLGDAALLRHAMTNLVDNAMRHGRVGDDIPTVIVTATYVAGHATVQVSDDGPGFPPDTDVLARYVSGPTGGTGLGLPLVLWIAEQHDATVELGGGTPEFPGAIVQITFPEMPVDAPVSRHRLSRRWARESSLTR